MGAGRGWGGEPTKRRNSMMIKTWKIANRTESLKNTVIIPEQNDQQN